MRLLCPNSEKLVIYGLSDEQSFSFRKWVAQRMAVALVLALFSACSARRCCCAGVDVVESENTEGSTVRTTPRLLYGGDGRTMMPTLCTSSLVLLFCYLEIYLLFLSFEKL